MSGIAEITQQPTALAALTLALAAAATDLRSRTVPNGLVAAGAAVGLLLNCFEAGMPGGTRSVLGAVAGLAVFLPFYLLGGMGGGDVKLMGALGACVGPMPALKMAVAAAAAGAVLAIVVAARRGVLARTLSGAGRLMGSWLTRGPRPDPELTLENPQALTIPYALPIAAGALLIAATGM